MQSEYEPIPSPSTPQDDGELLLDSMKSNNFFDFSMSNEFRHQNYESLDYDPIENTLAKRELFTKPYSEFRKYFAIRWLIVFFIGSITAIFGFGVDMGNLFLTKFKFNITNELIRTCENDNCVITPYIVYIAISMAFVLVSTLLVNYVEPAAAGSGIPEVKSYLNGVKIQRVVRMKTLFVKTIGVFLALSGGLVVGKAAPMIHTGAIVAAGIGQGQALSFSQRGLGFLKYFRNDHEKRDFVAAGVAAGVSAAFGAPIGGVLFAVEDGASFWKRRLLWQTFFCSMVSTFTLNFFLSGTLGAGWGILSQAGLISFGAFDGNQPGYNLEHFPFFLLLGLFGGLFGAAFNAINVKLTQIRQLWAEKKRARVIEAVVVALITATFSFMTSYIFKICKPTTDESTADKAINFNFYCAEGEYNEMASLFFNTQERSIKELFHDPIDYDYHTLLLFLIIYYFLACLTFGVCVPSGAMVPSLVIGCTFGRLYGQVINYFLPQLNIEPGTFALLGAAAMAGGIFRMTISMTVILIETTNDISYGLPIMVTLMVAKWVGDFFNKGIYDTHMTFRKIPYLGWDSPLWMRKYRAVDVMSRPVISFRKIEKVKQIIQILRECSHNGFPVLDSHNHFVGSILRSQLAVLIDQKIFIPANPESQREPRKTIQLDDFRRYYPRFPDIKDVSVTREEEDMYIDLDPYLNPLPYSIQQNSTLARTFRLFRTMGLRHLVVVSEDNHVVGMITRKDLAYLNERSLNRFVPPPTTEFD